MKELFTVGYAAFDNTLSFIDALKKNNVEVIADVRSIPHSAYKPDFNKDALIQQLKKNNIKYVFLGDCCGARINDSSCYTDGHVDYAKVKETSSFKKGIERILDGLSRFNISLLCAEKDPIYCHRDILVCHNLKSYNVTIKHILAGGRLENNLTTESRLLQILNLANDDLFVTPDERLEIAYQKQGTKIAYKMHEEVDK